MLVGGDKRDDWSGWYERNIPLADDLLDAHLDALRRSRDGRPHETHERQGSPPPTPAEPRARRAIKRSLELDIALNELRERRGITQEQVAAQLETSRPNVSRIEREDDVRVTTLQRYVTALGGELESPCGSLTASGSRSSGQEDLAVANRMVVSPLLLPGLAVA